MTVLERLKMELNHQEYFKDNEYIQFLSENGFDEFACDTDEYNKSTMQRQLLLTVLDILEAVSNDIDVMTAISTEFANIGQAYKYMESRISQLKDKIASIPEPEEEYSCFSLMFSGK